VCVGAAVGNGFVGVAGVVAGGVDGFGVDDFVVVDGFVVGVCVGLVSTGSEVGATGGVVVSN
jgi:hypothetical protein